MTPAIWRVLGQIEGELSAIALDLADLRDRVIELQARVGELRPSTAGVIRGAGAGAGAVALLEIARALLGA